MKIFTSTCCRPDYVQLLAWSLRKTVAVPYTFTVVTHPGAAVRKWDAVDAVVAGQSRGYMAWRDIRAMLGAKDKNVIIHDDCIPVTEWSDADFGRSHTIRFAGATLQFHDGVYRPPLMAIDAARIDATPSCPSWWPGELCKAAVAANAESILGGKFLHIDKGTIASPTSEVNEHKPALVAAICKHLGIDEPTPLTAEEMAIHPGRNMRAVSAPKPRGLGDMVKAGLSAVGITEDRVSKLIGRPCGCGARAEALNRLGAKLGIGGNPAKDA